MKLFRLVAVTAVLTLVGTTVALATSDDHGRRLAGPFCVSLSTGVLRVVAVDQPCKAGEGRKLGLALPVRTGPRGPQGPPGKDGTGQTGATGPQGAQGNQGPQGGSGTVTVTQLDGDQAGCVQITGSDGSTAVLCPPPCTCKCDTAPPEWPWVQTDPGYTKPS